MHPYANRLLMGALLFASAGAGVIRIEPIAIAHAHESFAAGRPGDSNKPARTIKVVMREDGKKMAFEPALIIVHKGEQIRFVLENAGTDDHEFVLATTEDNRKHAELMKKFPDMEHDDPNAKRLAPAAHGEILWRFTKPVHPASCASRSGLQISPPTAGTAVVSRLAGC